MWMRLAASMVLMAGVQAPAPPDGATLTLVQRAAEPLYFSNPALGKGTIRPIPGSRLEMVVIAVGDAPIAEVDIRQFALISADGVLYEPIAAGGGPDLIFPIDSLPLGREMGQILPNDAQVLMKRISTTSVMLEADPRATLAFVFQLPARSATRAFRLPGGSELALTR